jgi:hypothetical protein
LRDIPFVKTEGEIEPPIFYVGWAGKPLYNNLTSEREVICGVQGGHWYPIVGRTAQDDYMLIDALCVDGRIQRGWMLTGQGLIRNLGRVFVPIYRGLPGEGF